MITVYATLIFLSFFLSHKCTALDKITPTQQLKDSGTVVSSNGAFKLGFFSPSNSKYRYAGIWYTKAPTAEMGVVWVANRDNPITDSSGGAVRISEDVNLQVLNGENKTVWSSNVSASDRAHNFPVAQLLDSGNLVLLGDDGRILWQSFEHPTDTALPNMKLTVIKDSGVRKMLQSWASPSDPSSGRFSIGIDSFAFPQLVIWAGDRPYWRSGPWNGNTFTGVQYDNSGSNIIGAGFILENDRQGKVSLTYYSTNQSFSSNYALSYQGVLAQKWWDESKRKWEVVWHAPDTECDFYGKCGAFGSCSSKDSPICRCMKGFEPKNKSEWNSGDFTGGCVRRTPLQCGRGSGKPDGFFRVKAVKVPDKADWSTGLDQDECRSNCQNSCSCLAYAFIMSAGCMSWGRDLIDIEELSSGGVDLYLRLAHSELGNKSKGVVIIITVAGCLGAISVLILVFLLWRRRTQKQGKGFQRKATTSDIFQTDEKDVNVEELPLLELKQLAKATNDFQDTNKLGRGGFGPVYKGRLEDGQEIAVKRLSTASGQGQEEFMNEVQLISKLQHRNLVRLLGCCVDKAEKLLVYEYMPNGSLDSFLFDNDPAKRKLLPWKKRYNIILGICRGLLYLHRDSRLKIIHRDLKASNILLDENLNPRISDFGMARIFKGKQDQDDTIRVVGTYGYMSPEYAMGGKYSEKSDVFSFGVLLLEIVSGQRNSLFWYEERSLSLIGYAYKLWTEDNVILLIDPVIAEPCFLDEIQKCIHVGLLCVQEATKDRPCISTVISMLNSETKDLPRPKEPGFTHRQISMNVGSSSQQSSANIYVSLTILSAR